MKKLATTLTIIFLLSLWSGLQAQDRDLQYYVSPDKTGLNEFEAPFTTNEAFEGLNVRIGGSNTLQFQAISHDNDAGDLPGLQNNFNLATSNLDLDVELADGMRMHLRTYLSSQHHTETYVKGGYLQVDRLDFIREGFASNLMDHVRIKVGHMEVNYGDTHFRRSDNGATIHNAFVGNYIMDSFTTEVGGEVYVYSGPVFGMIGLTNGHLNQSTEEEEIKTKPTFLAKLGYDKQINDDFRFRLTGSLLRVSQSSSIYLYSGDRAGSRYYNVIEAGNFRAGRFSPSFTPGYGQPAAAGEMTSIMINPFLKYSGLEFFGVFENVSGQVESESSSRSYTQLGAELIYRFGANEDFYIGGRYNTVSGEQPGGTDIEISRVNFGGGWFLTDNVLTKLDYVSQKYDKGFSGPYAGAEFNGLVIEAVVSF